MGSKETTGFGNVEVSGIHPRVILVVEASEDIPSSPAEEALGPVPCSVCAPTEPDQESDTLDSTSGSMDDP